MLIVPIFAHAVPESEYALIYDLMESDSYTYKTLSSRQGLELNYLKYGEERLSNGSVVILPGRTEASVKYLELAYDLAQKNYGPIYILSHRGQGLSQRKLKNQRKGYVRKFSYYAEDLNQFMNEVVYPEVGNTPLFLIAHSMGGAVATEYLQTFPSHFQKVVLASPMLQIKLSESERSTLFKTSLVCRIPFKPYCTSYIPGGNDGDERDTFEENVVTSSKVRFSFQEYFLNKWPQLKLGSPTYRWVRESLIATRKMRHPKAIARIEVPMLLLQASQEVMVENFGQDQFCQRSRWCTKKTYTEAKHELLMERDEIRDQVIQDILTFLKSSIF